jgi:hypothetical protein
MAVEPPRQVIPPWPQVIKGALALYDRDAPDAQPDLVVFQYNADEVRRTLANRAAQPQPGGRAGAPEDTLRVPGPPVETITMSVTLDATDQLARPDENETVATKGIHPALAALEMAMYPPSLDQEEMERRAGAGEVQVAPVNLPLTVLVWGQRRVTPVAVTSFSITEQAFDRTLNPIRAKVDLGFRVLTYLEMPGDSLGRDAFFAYYKSREELAAMHRNSGDPDRIRSYLPQRR